MGGCGKEIAQTNVCSEHGGARQIDAPLRVAYDAERGILRT
jgi:hypothetical protein